MDNKDSLGHSLDALGGVVPGQLVEPLLHLVIDVFHLHIRLVMVY